MNVNMQPLSIVFKTQDGELHAAQSVEKRHFWDHVQEKEVARDTDEVYVTNVADSNRLKPSDTYMTHDQFFSYLIQNGIGIYPAQNIILPKDD